MLDENGFWDQMFCVLAMVFAIPVVGWGYKFSTYSRCFSGFCFGVIIAWSLIFISYHPNERYHTAMSIFIAIFSISIVVSAAVINPACGNFIIVAFAAYLMSLLQCVLANFSDIASVLVSLCIAILLASWGYSKKTPVIMSTAFTGAAIVALCSSNFYMILSKDKYNGSDDEKVRQTNNAQLLVSILYGLFLLGLYLQIQININAQEVNQPEAPAMARASEVPNCSAV